MTRQKVILILVCAGAFGLMALIIYISTNYNLNRIKARTVGDGQHGTARWAAKSEIRRTYRSQIFTRRMAKRRLWDACAPFPAIMGTAPA